MFFGFIRVYTSSQLYLGRVQKIDLKQRYCNVKLIKLEVLYNGKLKYLFYFAFFLLTLWRVMRFLLCCMQPFIYLLQMFMYMCIIPSHADPRQLPVVMEMWSPLILIFLRNRPPFGIPPLVFFWMVQYKKKIKQN